MDGVLTSAILVPEHGPPVWERPLHIRYPDDGIEMLPMEHWLDAQAVDDRTVEMVLRDALRNPWGILHGGVTAALVDACVELASGGGVTPRHRPALRGTEPGRAGAGDGDGPRLAIRRRRVPCRDP